MKKAAILGLGDIYPIHRAAILGLEGVRLAALCDSDPAARENAPQNVPFYTDLEQMVAEAKPDCVHVCLPHHLHYPVAQRLAELGCSVFCEKPLAMTEQQARDFAALEAAYPELHFGVCLQNRFNETTLRLKSIIESGEYGRVTGAKGLVPWARTRAYYDAKPWRGTYREAGGGTMMNQSIHTLDLLHHLCGPVKRLHAATSRLLDYGIEVEDTVTTRLEFENGAGGVFWATNANYDNESTQITVALEKAVFHIEDGKLTRRDPDGTCTHICEDRLMPGTKFYYGASHASLIGAFYAGMESGRRDYVRAADGVMSIRLIEAIVRSSQTGRAVELD